MQEFNELLILKNIKIINPLWDSIRKEKVVGWHISSPSIIRKTHSMEFVEGLIKDNNLDYYLEEVEFTDQFFVYINQEKSDT